MRFVFKKSIIVLIVFVLIVLAFPSTTHAGLFCPSGIFPFDAICQVSDLLGFKLFDPTAGFGQVIANILVGIITFIPATIFFVVAGVTNWIIHQVATLSVVPPAAPLFVNNGFAFMRQLVNIFFLVILVFIGLATILRLQEYQLQRTLPKLILIALLVNFSALLVGFVVDVANIAATFFLNSIGSGFGFDGFEKIFKNIGGQVNTIFESGDSHALMSSLALGLVLALFFLFATLIYLGIAVLFSMRIIILWTLVILAPLAFLASVLPATRKWWNQWLNSLIQWSFVAVPISFFMWLAQQALLSNAGPEIVPDPVLTDSSSNFQDLIASIVSPMAALVLLGIGMSVSLAIGPGIISRAVNTGKKVATIAAGAAGGFLARDLIRDNLARSARVQQLAQRMETASSNRAGIAGTLLRAGSAPTRWAGRQIGSKAQVGIKNDVAKAETEAKNWSAEETASRLKGNVSSKKKLGWLNARIKAGEINDVVRAGFDERQIQPILNQAIQTGQHQDLEAAFPHLVGPTTFRTHARYRRLRTAAAMRNLRTTGVAPAGPGGAYTDAQIETATTGLTDAHLQEEFMRRMKPDRAKQVSEGILADTPEMRQWQEAMLRAWGGQHMGSFIGQHREEGVTVLENRLRSLATAGPGAIPAGDPRIAAIVTGLTNAGVPNAPPTFEATSRARMRLWLQDNHNNPLAKYLQSQGGQNLGFNA